MAGIVKRKKEGGVCLFSFLNSTLMALLCCAGLIPLQHVVMYLHGYSLYGMWSRQTLWESYLWLMPAGNGACNSILDNVALPSFKFCQKYFLFTPEEALN